MGLCSGGWVGLGWVRLGGGGGGLRWWWVEEGIKAGRG